MKSIGIGVILAALTITNIAFAEADVTVITTVSATESVSTTSPDNAGAIIQAAEMQIRTLERELEAKIKALKLEYRAKMEAVRKDAKMRAGEFRIQKKEMRVEARDERREELAEQKENAREERKEEVKPSGIRARLFNFFR
ncbi:MAG: hypothetical protein AAB447_03490 [Patescibacteria group bacterium]